MARKKELINTQELRHEKSPTKIKPFIESVGLINGTHMKKNLMWAGRSNDE